MSQNWLSFNTYITNIIKDQLYLFINIYNSRFWFTNIDAIFTFFISLFNNTNYKCKCNQYTKKIFSNKNNLFF